MKRLISAAVLIPAITALVILAPSPVFSLAVAASAGLSALEYSRISSRDNGDRCRPVTVGLAVLLSLSVTWYHELTWAPLAAVLLPIPVLGLCYMSSRAPLQDSSAGFIRAFFGLVYTGGLFGMVGLLHASGGNGPAWVLALLGGVAMTDTGAYALGRLLGKRRLAPRVSPKKTWAGVFGGFGGTILGIAVVKLVFFDALGWYAALMLGVVLSPCAQLGDLIASYIKRGFDADDSGDLIPGHGGMIDLFDSLMLSAPVVVVFSAIVPL